MCYISLDPDDLPVSLRRHLEGQRTAKCDGAIQWGQCRWQAWPHPIKFCCLHATTFQEWPTQRWKRRSPRGDRNWSSSRPESTEVNQLLFHGWPGYKKGIDAARKVEWGKYENYNAATPVIGDELRKLLDEGHVPIPSQWIDVDKNELRGSLNTLQNFDHVWFHVAPSYEDQLRTDSPTSDRDTHYAMICAWCASVGVELQAADVTSAYFQGHPLDRVLLMKQPRGGLPGFPPEAMLLVRVPVYGLCDSGRGFWLRLDDDDAKSSGIWQQARSIQLSISHLRVRK